MGAPDIKSGEIFEPLTIYQVAIMALGKPVITACGWGIIKANAVVNYRLFREVFATFLN